MVKNTKWLVDTLNCAKYKKIISYYEYFVLLKQI